MKVRFVTTYPPAKCGIAIYCERLVDALKKLCAVDVMPVDSPRSNPFYFMKLARQARKDADIVHVQYDCGFFGTIAVGRFSLSGMYTPLFYRAVRRNGGPHVVTTIHELQDVDKKYGGRMIYLPMHLYYKAIYGAIVRSSEAVIVHTAATIETLSQYTKAPNAVIVPLAVHVRPAILPTEASKAKLGLAGKRVIVMFGFISPPKGHDLAIEAMRGLPEDVVLYIAGGGRTPADEEYARGLRDKAQAEGLRERVVFHGYVADDEVPVVMSAADIVLMPYRHVVQSAALSNALAYLKPVLASDIGGFEEIAKEYGCIETFPGGDSAALRAKMLSMLSGTATLSRLRENAVIYVSSMSLESIAARTVSIYGQLVEQKK